MKLLVAIHDVTPALAIECRRLWYICARHNIVPALFVVPNWHGQWPLGLYGRFVDWLRACTAEGAEIFLHGERHDEMGSARNWRDHLRALGRTDHEGEFLTRDATTAHARMQRGTELLRRLNLDPVGFAPPAWLAQETTYAAARLCGFKVSEDGTSVRLHSRGMRLHAPALRWSSRTALRERISPLVARARWTLQQHEPLMRLALHPSDLHSSRTTQSLKYEIDRWTEARTVWKYTQL
jgi:predicted deacetylase